MTMAASVYLRLFNKFVFIAPTGCNFTRFGLFDFLVLQVIFGGSMELFLYWWNDPTPSKKQLPRMNLNYIILVIIPLLMWSSLMG